jgi:hypothetical protein
VADQQRQGRAQTLAAGGHQVFEGVVKDRVRWIFLAPPRQTGRFSHLLLYPLQTVPYQIENGDCCAQDSSSEESDQNGRL